MRYTRAQKHYRTHVRNIAMTANTYAARAAETQFLSRVFVEQHTIATTKQNWGLAVRLLLVLILRNSNQQQRCQRIVADDDDMMTDQR